GADRASAVELQRNGRRLHPRSGTNFPDSHRRDRHRLSRSHPTYLQIVPHYWFVRAGRYGADLHDLKSPSLRAGQSVLRFVHADPTLSVRRDRMGCDHGRSKKRVTRLSSDRKRNPLTTSLPFVCLNRLATMKHSLRRETDSPCSRLTASCITCSAWQPPPKTTLSPRSISFPMRCCFAKIGMPP